MKPKYNLYNVLIQRALFLIPILLMLLPLSLSAQKLEQSAILVNLHVNSRPTAYLADWYKPVNGVVVLSSRRGVDVKETALRFETELIDLEGDVVYRLPHTQSDEVFVSGVTANFPLSTILQLQNGEFISPRLANDFTHGGKLHAGQYALRLRIWHPIEDMPVTEWTSSKPFLISSYNLPQLTQPADGAVLNSYIANSAVTFRWTPLTPAMQSYVASYRIQIWQVQPDMTPMQTLRSIPPIEDRIIKGTTQFLWQPRLNIIDEDPANPPHFIWTIQTLDEKGMPVESTDLSMQGISQPFEFSFAKKQTTETAELSSTEENDH